MKSRFRRPSARMFLKSLLLLITSLSSAQTIPPQSTFFSTVAEESYATYQLHGDGDLWPTCWADDDNLYTANGDGVAFTGRPVTVSNRYDMAVSVISGTPPNLSGNTLATKVGKVWIFNDGQTYNRKPTGMLCINGDIYLAYQNLATTFGSAPAASVVVSTDHGRSWSADSDTPMFGTPGDTTSPEASKFTTIFFLDFGKNSTNAIDGYVYAYGLDTNWRNQQAVYLARVPRDSVLTRANWQFYSGMSGHSPTWSSDITHKVAVLIDTTLRYPVMFDTNRSDNIRCGPNQPVISQGGIVYDRPLQRYIYTSWSCATHEIYEAPQPWGPWSHAASIDFGPLQGYAGQQNYGQYGPTIPSKFISSDGKSMYLQANVCCGVGSNTTGPEYTFSLRKLYLQPFVFQSPGNEPSTANLALARGARAISKSTHFGSLCALNCADQLNYGAISNSEDDWDAESKTFDWWGYTWALPYHLNQVVYETGNMFPDGGWFAGHLRVQVRQNFVWLDVNPDAVTPTYPYSNQAGGHTIYTFNLPNTWGDGVRIIGTPGGTSHFTSISHLSVYYRATNLAGDPGFELQTRSTNTSPWSSEGPDGHGVDRELGFAHRGSNNAWIRGSTSNWNAITQTMTVQENTIPPVTGRDSDWF